MSIASGALTRRDHITDATRVKGQAYQAWARMNRNHTIGSHNGGTTREAMYTMNKNNATRTKCLVDKATGMRHPEEEILVRPVFNGYAQVPYARLWMMSGDWFGANRYDMCYAALCQRAGRLCRDKTRGE